MIACLRAFQPRGHSDKISPAANVFNLLEVAARGNEREGPVSSLRGNMKTEGKITAVWPFRAEQKNRHNFLGATNMLYSPESGCGAWGGS